MREAEPMERRSRHELVPHTADVRIRIEASDLAGIFEEAARALAEVMGGDALPEPPAEAAAIEIQAADREALLVEWLNELVFRSETERRLFPRARVEDVSDRRLLAHVRAVEVVDLKTPVKAATWHGLSVREAPAGWTAEVVLDV